MFSKPSLALPILLAILLPGCAAGVFEHPPQAAATLAECLPIVSYTPAQETEAQTEYANLPAHSVLRTMLDDYLRERDELRACSVSK